MSLEATGYRYEVMRSRPTRTFSTNQEIQPHEWSVKSSSDHAIREREKWNERLDEASEKKRAGENAELKGRFGASLRFPVLYALYGRLHAETCLSILQYLKIWWRKRVNRDNKIKQQELTLANQQLCLLRREKMKQLYNREFMEFEKELSQRYNKTFYKKRV